MLRELLRNYFYFIWNYIKPNDNKGFIVRCQPSFTSHILTAATLSVRDYCILFTSLNMLSNRIIVNKIFEKKVQ